MWHQSEGDETTLAPISEAGRTGPDDHGWGTALLRAGILLVLSWAAFLLVPDRLMVYLSTRVAPHTRDVLVTLWVLVAFVGLCVLLVALQRGRRR